MILKIFVLLLIIFFKGLEDPRERIFFYKLIDYLVNQSDKGFELDTQVLFSLP